MTLTTERIGKRAIKEQNSCVIEVKLIKLNLKCYNFRMLHEIAMITAKKNL